jgi:FtsZ-binding cell division protein ZapB
VTPLAPKLLCPACEGDGTIDTCPRGCLGVCPCATITIECETCEGEGSVVDEDAPLTVEAARDGLDHVERQLDAADETLRLAELAVERLRDRRDDLRTERQIARGHVERLTREGAYAQTSLRAS